MRCRLLNTAGYGRESLAQDLFFSWLGGAGVVANLFFGKLGAGEEGRLDPRIITQMPLLHCTLDGEYDGVGLHLVVS